MHTVKLNVHPDNCTCSLTCPGWYVVNMPDTGLPPKKFRTWEDAVEQIRDYAAGPPVGQPGVHGPVRAPDPERLKH